MGPHRALEAVLDHLRLVAEPHPPLGSLSVRFRAAASLRQGPALSSRIAFAVHLESSLSAPEVSLSPWRAGGRNSNFSNYGKANFSDNSNADAHLQRGADASPVLSEVPSWSRGPSHGGPKFGPGLDSGCSAFVSFRTAPEPSPGECSLCIATCNATSWGSFKE